MRTSVEVSQSGGNSLYQGPGIVGPPGMVGDAERRHWRPAPVGLCGPLKGLQVQLWVKWEHRGILSRVEV